ncbi:MAG: hypothetical protein QOI24_942 [Acidobacteriota bacterium]|nr:hypothetical protein [Acidobacteriota bacterium]
MAVANCPSCGAAIEFAVGSSIVVVCDYCRSVVARTDRALEDLGKIAAIVDTGSPLQRNLPGKYRGVGFRLTGRTQMRHSMGGVWDEWYAAFDDGRWGWIAEAQGRYYVTFKTAATDVPPLSIIEIGGMYRDMVIDEIGKATLVSGEGEIPWRVEPGSEFDYADLSGTGERFATIDYSEDSPLLFHGEQTTLAALGINTGLEPGRRGARITTEKLSCSNCGGPLQLVAPDATERVVCPNCGGIHDVADGGLRYLNALAKKGPQPRIPLGRKGTVDGEEWIVAGFMQRFVTFDQKYYWTEYLLFNAKTKSFGWLVDSDEHWSIARAIPSAEVSDPLRNDAASSVTYKGKKFKVFQDAKATVSYVVGEFFWRVEVGETSRAVDYIAPPEGITKEISGGKNSREVNYTLARYLPVADVEKAFGVKSLPRPSKVGMIQPYVGHNIGGVFAALVIALFVIAFLLAVTRSRTEVLRESLDLTGESSWGEPVANSNAAQPARAFFTKPFNLTGKNLRVEAYSPVTNSWVYVAGDIVNEKSGLLEGFDLPVEFYEGYDGGEHWSEGSRTKTVFLSALPAGSYAMRLEAQWPAGSPPSVMVRVTEGVFRWSHFFLALILITIPAIMLAFRRFTFEASRWSESMYTQMGTLRSASEGDDDDE